MDARQRFDEGLEAIKTMGVAGVGPLLERWRGDAGVKLPWHDRAVMMGVQRVADDSMDKVVEMVRRLIETMAEPLKVEFVSLNRSNPLLK